MWSVNDHRTEVPQFPLLTHFLTIFSFCPSASPCDDNTNVLGVYDAVMCDKANSENATGMHFM
jgi:hypothetical protein